MLSNYSNPKQYENIFAWSIYKFWCVYQLLFELLTSDWSLSLCKVDFNYYTNKYVKTHNDVQVAIKSSIDFFY